MYEQIEAHCRAIRQLEKKNANIQAEIENNPGEDRRAKLYARKLVNLEMIETLKHEIHCACVVLGIADRNDKRYGKIITPGPLGDRTVHRRDPAEQQLQELPGSEVPGHLEDKEHVGNE